MLPSCHMHSESALFDMHEGPSTRKRRFRPQIRRVLETLSRLQVFKNGDLSYSCGRLKTKVFEYDDVKVKVQCTRPQISISMAAINRMLVPLLRGLISSFITLLQLQVAYINLQADYARRRLVITCLISLPVNKTAALKRLNQRACRRPRRFWTRPGRTSVWWEKFVNEIITPEEWWENFRMSKESLYQ